MEFYIMPLPDLYKKDYPSDSNIITDRPLPEVNTTPEFIEKQRGRIAKIKACFGKRSIVPSVERNRFAETAQKLAELNETLARAKAITGAV